MRHGSRLTAEIFMRITKIRERIRNAADALFDCGAGVYDENALSCAEGAALLSDESAAQIHEKADIILKILKRAFVFLPGSLYLFFASMFGFSYQVFRENPLTIFVVFLIGGFMTIFGIGDIRNPKHVLIPISIVAVGLTAFSLFAAVGQLSRLLDYGIYFFPVALVVSVLAKNLADTNE